MSRLPASGRVGRREDVVVRGVGVECGNMDQTEAQRQDAGIGQGLIRVAVGLEYPQDVQKDLSRGLDTL